MTLSEKTFIVCVDDEKIVTNAIMTLLRPYSHELGMVETANSGEEALDIIDELIEEGNYIPVVIADFIMPEMMGDEFLIKIHQKLPHTKTILLTGQSQIDGIKNVINQANLYRFIEKPWHNDDLLLTLRGAVNEYNHEKEIDQYITSLRDLNQELERKVEERTKELVEKNKELLYLSSTDRLTQVYNRLKIEEIIAFELERCFRYEHGVSLVIVDIDHFKTINDTQGHLAGDEVLKQFAAVLQENIRETDYLGRWGGEEFLIICPECGAECVKVLTEKLRALIEETVFVTAKNKLTASFGMTTYQEGDTKDTLLGRADINLYKAKSNGRNMVVF